MFKAASVPAIAFVMAFTTGLSASEAQSTKRSRNTNVTVEAPRVSAPVKSSGWSISRVTPRIAMMSSNTDGDSAFNDSRNGLHVSATTELQTPATGLAIESGLVYEQMGASQKSTTGNETSTFGYRLNYLKVPLYAKYYLPMNASSKVFVKAGPSLGFLVSKTQFEESRQRNAEEDLRSEDVNTVQFAGELGVGWLIPIGAHDLMLDWGYTRGFNRVNARGNESIYNSAFNMGVGMSFNL